MPDVKDRDTQIGESYASGRGSYDPRELADGEASPYVNSGTDQAEQFANDLDNHVSDSDVRSREEAPSLSENNGGWQSNVDAEHKNSSSTKVRGSLKAGLRKKGPMAALITTLVVGLAAGGGFLSSALGPIAFVENVVDDLNDQLAAMDIAGTKVLRGKIPTAERKEALRGCTKLSIRCKFATLSNRQVSKLKASGITVEVDKTYRNLTGMKRNVPVSYEFQGTTYSPDQWAEQLRTNRAAINAQRKANNMKFLGMADGTFTNKVLKRFGISKKPPELTGTPQERVNALLSRAGGGTAADIKFTPVDSNGNTVSEDSPSKVGYQQDGAPPRTNEDGSPRPYTDSEVERMRNAVNRVTTPPSRVTNASVGALSALGYWDLACSIRNMIGAASVAAKVASQAELIAYSMDIMSTVHEMKSGDISAEDAQAVGEFFMETDGRPQIPNVSESVNTNSNGDISVTDGPLAMTSNPNYRKNALDSGLYQMSSLGGVARPNSGFSLGVGQNTLLAGVANAAEIATVITSVGTGGGACNFVQNGVVRLIGIIGAVAAGIASWGATLAVQAAVAGGLIAVMWIVESILNNALGGSIIESADLVQNTVYRGDAVWTGAAGIMSTAAQSRGMMPGTADEIVEYAVVSNQVNQEYIAIEREDTHPLDIYSQYSFLGSLSRSFLQHSPSSINITSIIGSVGSMVRSGFVAPFADTHAKSIDPERFKRCDDDGYKNLNKNFGASNVSIDADVQCNIRFIMPAADLALEPDDVINWMETNKCGSDHTCVEPDTTTGFPRGYTPQEPKAAQDGILGFVNETASGFIGQFYNNRIGSIDDYNDYAKFLDFCAYRVLPFGETFEDNQAINDVGNDWKTGAKCMEKSTQMSYFRMYTLYLSVNDAIDADIEEPEQVTSPSTIGTPDDVDIAGRGWTIKQNTDYTSISCAPGTTFERLYNHSIANSKFNLCTVDGTTLLINSLVSANVRAMVDAAAADGVTLNGNSTFRSVEEQQQVYNQNCRGGSCSPPTATPGASQHERGLAIDFMNCGTRGTQCYQWLSRNAETYGYYNLESEPWHWSPSGW